MKAEVGGNFGSTEAMHRWRRRRLEEQSVEQAPHTPQHVNMLSHL